MEHYDDADWFPQSTWEKPEVLEEIKRMSGLNGGLALLWFPKFHAGFGQRYPHIGHAD
jgi:hypothetical protein